MHRLEPIDGPGPVLLRMPPHLVFKLTNEIARAVTHSRPTRCCAMGDALKKTYLSLLLPAVVTLLLAYGARGTGLIPAHSNISVSFIAPCFFVLSVALAVAAPILLRSVFAHRVRNQQTVAEPAFVRFEKRLIGVALISPYLLLPAYLLNFPDFYFIGMALSALYAAYYFYPSKRRIQFEKRIFRVK